ncbi:MAG: hypothetical protein KDK90_15675 [Leptospiraceae bacterium]|nr:hypothetical protein [Leptospiraceae bacterium]
MKNYKLMILLIVLFAFNCISLKKEFPEKKFYIIEPDKTKIVKRANKIDKLKINKLKISPFFEGKELVYRKNDVNYETDFYNEFLIYPASNITEQVITWLISSGFAKYSINRAAGLDSTYILDGNINLLYGDFKSEKPKAILEIEFYLFDHSSNVLFKKLYHTETELEKKEPAYLIKGWNLGLTKIILNLEDDLRKVTLKKEAIKESL